MKKMITVCIFLSGMLVATSIANAQVSIGVGLSVRVAPPPLPVYEQPPCPGDGYLWTPGYWAYGADDYYWVPGVWVLPPVVGVLWTPGYWGFMGGIYRWHRGYWGPRVGFYGGINYGFGYNGTGFAGGMWHGNVFRYNRAVMNVNPAVVHNIYENRTVIHNRIVVNNHASFNGRGGINARPSAGEEAAMRERRFQPTSVQRSQEQAAGRDRSQFASVNHGRPGITAMNSVNGRRYNQQGRIAEGVHQGQLSPSQAARAENREHNIHHSVTEDRRANGGRLTNQQRQHISHRQTSVSRQIHREKRR